MNDFSGSRCYDRDRQSSVGLNMFFIFPMYVACKAGTDNVSCKLNQNHFDHAALWLLSNRSLAKNNPFSFHPINQSCRGGYC